MAYIGRAVYGYIGILAGVSIGQIIVGVISWLLAKHKMHPDGI
jgi:tetrahydromethanopterin S-methyltransferase subunit G